MKPQAYLMDTSKLTANTSEGSEVILMFISKVVITHQMSGCACETFLLEPVCGSLSNQISMFH